MIPECHNLNKQTTEGPLVIASYPRQTLTTKKASTVDTGYVCLFVCYSCGTPESPLPLNPGQGSDSPGEIAATRSISVRGQRCHVPYPRWPAEYVRHVQSRGSVAPMILPPNEICNQEACGRLTQSIILGTCDGACLAYTRGLRIFGACLADTSGSLILIVFSNVRTTLLLKHDT